PLIEPPGETSKEPYSPRVLTSRISPAAAGASFMPFTTSCSRRTSILVMSQCPTRLKARRTWALTDSGVSAGGLGAVAEKLTTGESDRRNRTMVRRNFMRSPLARGGAADNCRQQVCGATLIYDNAGAVKRIGDGKEKPNVCLFFGPVGVRERLPQCLSKIE